MNAIVDQSDRTLEPVRTFIVTSLVRGDRSPDDPITRLFEGREEYWLRVLLEWDEGFLWTGDGGSSPLHLSTAELIHVPPGDAGAAERLREELERSFWLRRLLRDIARIQGEQLQSIGAGNPGFAAALERLRMALLLSAATSHRRAQLACEIPSRISMGADYLLLMLLRKHDPTFDDYVDVLGWALPTFTSEPSLQPQGSRCMTFPVFPLGSVRAFYDETVVAAALPRPEGDQARHDHEMNLFRQVLILAGMVLEHGTDRLPLNVDLPPRATLTFLRGTQPDQWHRWEDLLVSIWGY